MLIVPGCFAALLHQTGTALQSSVGDTVLVKQVASYHGWLERITEIATLLIALALLVTVSVAIPVAVRLRRLYRKASQLLDRVQTDVQPVLEQAQAISEDVHEVTTSIRKNVEMVNETIRDANQRLHDTLEASERRVSELNALLSVVQEEAERLFVSTASTVRGVRQGAAAFHEADGMDLASDELEAADPGANIEFQEEVDGHDHDTQPPAETVSATAPRVRPRNARHTRRR